MASELIDGTVEKKPAATRWFGFNLYKDINPAKVASSAWTAADGLTVADQSRTDYTVVVKLAGGVDGTDYLASCTYTLDNGEIDSKTLLIRVRR